MTQPLVPAQELALTNKAHYPNERRGISCGPQ